MKRRSKAPSRPLNERSAPQTAGGGRKSTQTGPLAAGGAQPAQLGGEPHAEWATLPDSALKLIFDKLGQRELAAAASSCRAWRAIASDDRLWGLLWQKDMGRGSCWRWARAAGGFREMLRAKTVVRRGRHTQANFPFDHRDGVVQEVLMLDGPNPMVITTQFKRPPSQAVRLAGITIKVWDARALAAQAPLLVVYDVLKHMQMEDGSLFLWAIEGDQIVDTGIPDGATGYISRMGPSPQHPWAENEHIKPYRLDAADQRLMEVPLASRFGQGTAQHEWFDLARGCVASIQLMQAEQVIRMRLYSLATGRCFKESSVSLDLPGVPRFELPDHDGMLLMNRTMAAVPNVIVTCALFDHRVFRWELQDEWFTPEYQARVAEAGLEAGQAGPDGTPGPHELRLMFVAPENEPVVELGISTDSHRIIVLAAEHLFLFNLAGTPLCFYDTQAWCGPDIPPATHAVDLGAFVWPLPHSERLVVYMERSHSVYVVDSQLPAVGRPSTDCLTPPHWQHASPPTDTFAACVYTLQSHEDLRTPKHAYGASAMGFLMTGRMRGNVIEAVIVEHTECGHVMFTSACTAAPPVAALLQRDALQDPSNAGKGKKSAAKEQWRNANKWGASWKRRALVAIDTATGQRFKAVVFDGCIESVHSAGHYLAVAVAPPDSAAEHGMGSLHILDFSKSNAFAADASTAKPRSRPASGRAAAADSLLATMAGGDAASGAGSSGAGKRRRKQDP